MSGTFEISKALQTNLTLKRLFLSNSNIRVGGALSIAVALCCNNTLEDLYMNGNEILDDGAIAIAKCLKTNRAIKYLSVCSNNIMEICVIEIMEVLKLNPVFKTLKLDKKCVEILIPHHEKLLNNEIIDRCYWFENLDGVDSSLKFTISLKRVWKN